MRYRDEQMYGFSSAVAERSNGRPLVRLVPVNFTSRDDALLRDVVDLCGLAGIGPTWNLEELWKPPNIDAATGIILDYERVVCTMMIKETLPDFPRSYGIFSLRNPTFSGYPQEMLLLVNGIGSKPVEPPMGVSPPPNF